MIQRRSRAGRTLFRALQGAIVFCLTIATSASASEYSRFTTNNDQGIRRSETSQPVAPQTTQRSNQPYPTTPAPATPAWSANRPQPGDSWGVPISQGRQLSPLDSGMMPPPSAVDEISGQNAIFTSSLPDRATQVAYPGDLSDVVVPENELTLKSGRLDPSKPGLFQKLTMINTWVPREGNVGVGVFSTEIFAVFGVPLPDRDSPLLITPGFGHHVIDGPITTDLPSSAYEAYLQLRWLRKINDCWGMDLAVSPGIYSDFGSPTGDAIRVTGHGFGAYSWNSDLKLILGIVYLDREDVSLLPAAGLIWTPRYERRLELIFPRPKFAALYNCGENFEDWWYVGGEFGGGSWEIDRSSGVRDIATIRDLRVMLGVERKKNGGSGFRFEVAYVFARELQYASNIPADVTLEDTLMLRTGLTY